MEGHEEVLVWIKTTRKSLVKTVSPINGMWRDSMGSPIDDDLDVSIRWWAWLKKP